MYWYLLVTGINQIVRIKQLQNLGKYYCNKVYDSGNFNFTLEPRGCYFSQNIREIYLIGWTLIWFKSKIMFKYIK
jgi:hypothetical protein